jgi:hypothetical protein
VTSVIHCYYIQRRVVWRQLDVSEENLVSFFRVEEKAELERCITKNAMPFKIISISSGSEEAVLGT